MKKNLLLAAFLMGSLLTAKAQTTISFETSEGFTAGDINGQNAWISTSYTDADGNTANIANQVVSNEHASVGTYAVKNATEADFDPQETPVIGVFKNITSDGADWTVEYDVYIVPEGDVADGNDYTFNLYSDSDANGGFAARVDFSYEGIVKVVGLDGTTLSYIDTDFEWAANTWYHVAIASSATNVTYTINDELVYEAAPLNTGFVTLALTVDNYGGTAYYDAIEYTGATAGVKNVSASNKLSVFPNPATNVVNVNAADALVNNVSVVDINGRTVKSVSFAGVSEAQVNVSDLASGVYMMTVSSDKGTTTQKIVKN